MTTKKFLLGAATMAVSLLTLSACAGGSTSPVPESTEAAGPLHVAVFGGLGAQGLLQDNAITSVTAATASVDAVNELGGVLDREVQLTTVDDGSDPTRAVTRLKELMSSDEKPDVVLLSGPSNVAEAMLPVLTQNKVVSFNIAPTAGSSDPTTNPYNFDLSVSVTDYVSSFVAEMESSGYENVAILHGSSAYGELFGSTTEAAFTEAGLTVVGNQGYDSASLDMTAPLDALRSANPDVLVLDAFGAPVGYVMQGIEKLAWDVPVLGNTSVPATALIATEPPTGILGTDQVKNLRMQVFASTKYDPSNERVSKAVEQMVGAGEIRSSLLLANNYDSMLLYRAAAIAVGSTEPEKIAEALLDPAVQKDAQTAILGLYAFAKDSHSPHATAAEFSFIAPGKLENGQFH